jgi:hypothetical protein
MFEGGRSSDARLIEFIKPLRERWPTYLYVSVPIYWILKSLNT